MGRPRSIRDFVTDASRSGRIPSGTASIVEDIYQTPRVIRETKKMERADGPGSLRSELQSIAIRRSKMPIDKAFWNLVNQPDEGCWDWMGGLGRSGPSGQGIFSYRGRKYLVPRLAFALANGRAVAEGASIFQTCGRPACCRPDHLYEAFEAAAPTPPEYDPTFVPASLELDVNW